MQNEMTNISQKDFFAQKLQSLKKDITEEDKRLAQSEISISKGTVSAYLNGSVKDSDLASKLIVFFSARIKARYDLVNSAVSVIS